ncbi:MAG TPA: hypothetical protein VK841_04410 [Polyangiaceae bacterium]|jgi:hypothetical protein|nr:hypothetical protein [Polyangiaceae bacterium]
MGEQREGSDPGGEPREPPGMTAERRSADTPMASMAMAWHEPPSKRVPSMVRELLSASYESFVEADELQRIVMVAHEMLENLAKYASHGHVTFGIELHEREGETVVELRSSNGATAEHLREAEGILARLDATAHPVTAYDELIAESTQRTGSRLGLARIRVEGEMDLEGFVEDGRITLVAERRVGPRRRS